MPTKPKTLVLLDGNPVVLSDGGDVNLGSVARIRLRLGNSLGKRWRKNTAGQVHPLS